MIWGKCNEFRPQARIVVGKKWGVCHVFWKPPLQKWNRAVFCRITRGAVNSEPRRDTTARLKGITLLVELELKTGKARASQVKVPVEGEDAQANGKPPKKQKETGLVKERREGKSLPSLLAAPHPFTMTLFTMTSAYELESVAVTGKS